MGLSDEAKQKIANAPKSNTGQTHEQNWDDDANPGEDNLASPSRGSGAVKSGRDLPGFADGDSAPKAVKRNPTPIPTRSDPNAKY